MSLAVTLDDKYVLEAGRVYLTANIGTVATDYYCVQSGTRRSCKNDALRQPPRGDGAWRFNLSSGDETL